jgi:hypothetical protein
MSYGTYSTDIIIVAQLKHHFIASARKMCDFSNSWTFLHTRSVMLNRDSAATRIEKRLEQTEKPAVIFQVSFTPFELARIRICLALNLVSNVN